MRRAYLVSLIMFTIWVALVVGNKIAPHIQPTSTQDVFSYDECLKAGYTRMLTDPPQCRTPDGKLFVGAKPNISSVPSSTPTPTHPATSSAAEVARADLAKKLVIGIDSITIVSQREADWPDGCLGIQKPGVMCTLAIVPGYEIILSFANELYTYRTNKDGSVIVQVL